MLANRRNNRAAQIAGVVLPAAARVAGNIARNYVAGALNGVGQRVYGAGQRYFKGDVSQPATATTVQQVSTMRLAGGRRRSGRNVRGDVITETGTMKIADVTTNGTAADITSGKALLSFPLQVETIGGRFFALSKLFSRWQLVRAVLRYVPSVSSATDGGLVVYYTQEPDDVYQVGEGVGAAAASSAVDNMEFSVREKANMPLHATKTLLYTTPGSSDRTWHSAGVVNVISNGSLVVSKTYGSLYLDFTARFSQATAPFDVYAPISAVNINPAGPGALGTGLGALFSWPVDAVKCTKESGSQWFIDPATQAVNSGGKIHMPPYSSVDVQVTYVDGNVRAQNAGAVCDGGVIETPLRVADRSTDASMKRYKCLITNTNPFTAGFTVAVGALAEADTLCSLSLSMVPYRTT